jgi:hypothetical protein
MVEDDEDEDEDEDEEPMMAKKKSKSKMSSESGRYSRSGNRKGYDGLKKIKTSRYEAENKEDDHDDVEHPDDHDDVKSAWERESGTGYSKKKMKKMLKGDQHKIDANKDGKISKEDFFILNARKKNHAKKVEESSWWNSVRGQMGNDPDHKFNDGCSSLFTPVDTNNLYQSLRQE